MIASGGGVHDIKANGQLVYSKHQTGKQPVPDEIVALVRRIL